jgi:hemolysin D
MKPMSFRANDPDPTQDFELLFDSPVERELDHELQVRPIQILIVDDQNFVRKMLQYSLKHQEDFEIAGMAKNGQEALELITALNPDIALVDVEMPDMDGLTLTQQLSELSAATRVIVLSVHDDETYIRKALKAGARGYLLKSTPAEELAHAIRFVQRGYLQLGPGLFEKLSATTELAEILAVQARDTAELSPPSLAPLERVPLTPPPQEEWLQVTQDFVNNLPQVWTRGLIYLLVMFIAVLIPWSILAKVDEVVVAQGRLEPRGKTIRLDAPVEGKVVTIHVKPGDAIAKGQPLVELQSDLVAVEIQQVEAKRLGETNRLSQLEVLRNQILNTISVQSQQNQAQSLEKQAQVTQAEQALTSSEGNAPLQESEKLALVAQAEANLDSAQRNVKLLQGLYQAELEEVGRFAKLEAQGAVTSIQVVEARRRANELQQQVSQAEAELAQAQKRLQEQQSGLARLKQQLASEQEQAATRIQEQQSGQSSLAYNGRLAILKNQEQLKDIERQMTELKSQITQSQTELKSLRLQQKQRIIYAPTDGTIYELPIQNPGAVVQPGQLIAQLAPQSSHLVLRAQIETRDAGLLKPGLSANLKFDAFPYQDYGLMGGKISWIAPNSSPGSSGSNSSSSGSSASDRQPPSLGLFELEFEMEKPYLEVGKQREVLKPGQTAKAEVVVRQRRVIDFFLEPFRKLGKSGLSL